MNCNKNVFTFDKRAISQCASVSVDRWNTPAPIINIIRPSVQSRGFYNDKIKAVPISFQIQTNTQAKNPALQLYKTHYLIGLHFTCYNTAVKIYSWRET